MISLVNANALHIPLADESAQCVITSPPYWGLRDYNADGQIGLEKTPEEYVCHLVEVFREVWRVLREDGTLWLNLGDSYAREGGTTAGVPRHWDGRKRDPGGQHDKRSLASEIGLKQKDLVGIPWRVAFALQADGWYLRSDIIWSKPNPMPESVTDRPTKAHEYIFLLSKSPRYHYDEYAIREPMSEATKERDRYGFSGAFKGQFRGTPGEERWQDGRPIETPQFYNAAGRNRRTVWTVATAPTPFAHFATFPPALVAPMVLAGTSAKGACPKCGTPWERAWEYIEKPKHTGNGKAAWEKHVREGRLGGLGGTSATTPAEGSVGQATPKRDLGWRPGCACDAGAPVPCVVLDPFAGSGTVGQVCRESGRSFVGLDLSYSYLSEIALARAAKKTNPEQVNDLPLFQFAEIA